jgi:hypothetical protein
MNDLADSESVVVLYIGGEGRSGSTVLSALLGNVAGLFPVGEVRDVWQALKTNELCGCGQPFLECKFWPPVGDRAFGGWHQVDVDAMLKMDQSFARQRRLSRLFLASLQRSKSESLTRYRRLLSDLYTAVKEVSGCSVIVDSTKDPAYALLVRDAPNLDVRFVHLVRDSRGVAYSWSKKHVERPEYGRHPVLRGTFMNSRSSWRAALEWDFKNLLFDVVAMSRPHEVVTYEALMAEPARELARLVQLVGTGETLQMDESGSQDKFEFLPFHTLGGNRVRFARGSIRLHVDNEWTTNMGRSQKVVVSALTAPLLVAYGHTRSRARWGQRIDKCANP